MSRTGHPRETPIPAERGPRAVTSPGESAIRLHGIADRAAAWLPAGRWLGISALVTLGVLAGPLSPGGGPVLAADVASPCTAVTVTATPSPVPAGQGVTIQAAPTCPSDATPAYSYFTRAGTRGPWTLRAAWIGATWTWATPGTPGTAQVLVWVTDGPHTVPQAGGLTTITLTTPVCGRLTVAPGAAVAVPGSAIALQASGACPGARFAFFARPGSARPWHLLRGWGAPTLRWNSAGWPVGPLQVLAWRGTAGRPAIQAIAQLTLVRARFVSGVVYHAQVYAEDCETAALQMALSHEGIFRPQPSLLTAEHVAPRLPVLRGSAILRWGDPYTSFVGWRNGQSNWPATSYGTFNTNIARVARATGGTVLWSGTGLGLPALYADVSASHPVIAWVASNDGHLVASRLAYWRAWDGRWIPYPTVGYEHAVLVVGVTPGAVRLDNPLPMVGPQWVSKAAFAATFRTFHDMAVVLR